MLYLRYKLLQLNFNIWFDVTDILLIRFHSVKNINYLSDYFHYIKHFSYINTLIFHDLFKYWHQFQKLTIGLVRVPSYYMHSVSFLPTKIFLQIIDNDSAFKWSSKFTQILHEPYRLITIILKLNHMFPVQSMGYNSFWVQLI